MSEDNKQNLIILTKDVGDKLPDLFSPLHVNVLETDPAVMPPVKNYQSFSTNYDRWYTDITSYIELCHSTISSTGVEGLTAANVASARQKAHQAYNELYAAYDSDPKELLDIATIVHAFDPENHEFLENSPEFLMYEGLLNASSHNVPAVAAHATNLNLVSVQSTRAAAYVAPQVNKPDAPADAKPEAKKPAKKKAATKKTANKKVPTKKAATKEGDDTQAEKPAAKTVSRAATPTTTAPVVASPAAEEPESGGEKASEPEKSFAEEYSSEIRRTLLLCTGQFNQLMTGIKPLDVLPGFVNGSVPDKIDMFFGALKLATDNDKTLGTAAKVEVQKNSKNHSRTLGEYFASARGRRLFADELSEMSAEEQRKYEPGLGEYLSSQGIPSRTRTSMGVLIRAINLIAEDGDHFKKIVRGELPEKAVSAWQKVARDSELGFPDTMINDPIVGVLLGGSIFKIREEIIDDMMSGVSRAVLKTAQRTLKSEEIQTNEIKEAIGELDAKIRRLNPEPMKGESKTDARARLVKAKAKARDLSKTLKGIGDDLASAKVPVALVGKVNNFVEVTKDRLFDKIEDIGYKPREYRLSGEGSWRTKQSRNLLHVVNAKINCSPGYCIATASKNIRVELGISEAEKGPDNAAHLEKLEAKKGGKEKDVNVAKEGGKPVGTGPKSKVASIRTGAGGSIHIGEGIPASSEASTQRGAV